uniref:Synaptobrevin, longin-like domain protein n=1 Tax=Tanacetum cinerariifolium TaxID=118510 RepID=A0A6L2K4F2_TANCI|nr:hypothetical protein [Tanacetum cinerariifolium]
MVAFLSKSDASAGFDQIVDFLNAQVIQYALMGKRVVVSEDFIRHDLRLDDADGVQCLPNEEIFTELARMGYQKPPPKLTFYKVFFSAQWKLLIHTHVQCISAKWTAWNEFSCSMASAVISLATGRKFNFSKYIFDSMVRNVDSPKEKEVEMPAASNPPSPSNKPLPPPQELITTPPQAQPAPPSSPPQEQQTKTSEVAQALEIFKLKRRVKKLEKKRISKSSGLKRLRKRRKDDDNATIKDASTAETTVFDYEEVTMTMAQTLIKMKAEKARLLDEQIAKRLHDEEVKQAVAREKQENDDLKKAKVLQQQYVDKQENIDWNIVVKQIQEKNLDNIKKYQSLKRKPISIVQSKKNMIVYLRNMVGYKMEHFRGMTYDKVRPIFGRDYKKVQTLFKPDKDVEEPTKKRVAEETLLLESFKKLKAVEVLSSHSTQDSPTDDPKEMSKEDVQNMLKIVPLSEFKVEALQVKYYLIDWEIHYEGSRSYWKIIRVGGITEAYQSFKDMLKGFDREDLDALWRLVKEKFSTSVPTVDKEKAL